VAFVAHADSPAEHALLTEQVAVVRGWWNPSAADRDLFDGRPVTRKELVRLQIDLGEVTEGSVVALYLTGHGSDAYPDYRLEAADRPYNPVPMVEHLIDSEAAHGLVIIDSCYAHRVEAPVKTYHGAVRRDPRRDRDRELPRMVVIVTGTADDPYETPAFGEFTTLLDEALDLLRDPRYEVPTSRRFLQANELRTVLEEAAKARVRSGGSPIVPNMVVPAPQHGIEESHALPNPAYVPTSLRGGDLEWSAPLIDEYWVGKAKGAPVAEPGWYFTGRAPVMRQVVSWLDDPEPEPLLVVTGARGTGKSAVLARTVTLADPGFRTDPQYTDLVAGIPDDLMPPAGVIDAAVDTRGRSAERVADLILRALLVDQVRLLGPDHPSTLTTRHNLAHWRGTALSVRERLADGLLTFVQARGRPACVVLDGIDESSSPMALVQDVLTALTLTRRDDGSPAARTIVGVRNDPADDTNLLSRIEDLADHRTVRTDLEDACAEVGVYCTQLLSRDHEPYTPRPDMAAEVSAWLSARESPNFLDARVIADALSLGTMLNPAELDSADLVGKLLPTTLRHTLTNQAATTTIPADDYLAALRALAFGRGTGIPWRDVWPAMAAAVADADPTSTDRWNRVIRHVLRGPLGAFVMTASDDDQRVFRPVHADITDILRDDPADLGHADLDLDDATADSRAVEARIATALAALVPADGPPDPYVRRHLIAHAALGGVLDDETVPERFLPWETNRRVRYRLGLPLPDDDHTRTLAAWAAVEPYLDQIPTPAERRIALRFQRLGRSPSPSGWRTWADRNVLVSAPGLSSMAVGEVDGRPLVATGSQDGTVWLWNLRSGKPAGPPLRGHIDRVWSAAFGQVDGRTLLATGSQDSTIRLWNLHSGELAAPPLQGHGSWVMSLAFGHVDGRTLLASGSDDNTVRLWDPAVGSQVGQSLRGHTGIVMSVAFGQVDGRTLLASGSIDGTVRLWDPTIGELVRHLAEHERNPVCSAGFGQVDGRTLLATGGAYGRLLLWDPTTGEPVGQPLHGHRGLIVSLGFGQVDGHILLATASMDRTARFWDPAVGRQVGQSLRGHTDKVWSVSFSQVDGRTLLATASIDGTVRLWDPAASPTGSRPREHTDLVQEVGFGQIDGRTLLASRTTNDTVRLWDPTTGRRIRRPLHEQTDGVGHGQVDGRTFLVSDSHDDTARLWDSIASQHVGSALHGHVCGVASPVLVQVDGRILLAAASQGRTVRLWDPTTAQPVGPPIHTMSRVNKLASADGFLALATDAGVAVLTSELLTDVVHS